ncbi:MAG: site-specific DNA-methyltransferase [Rhodobacterales bacterium 32-67-9]|nr:MAG: site-specific DNA-methyltransferase [Rhodobacterales bacterium 32-67-9]
MNALYFGDNLEVLREHVKDHTVDLIYLDPPFNSDARYNVLFESPDEKRRSAQAEAFRDTWFWDHEAEDAFRQVAQIGGPLALFVNALYGALGRSDLMAYLVMMAVRLHELRRVLKPSGSLYIHCDPTASHYLKIMLDGIFGPELFRNEIVWNRTGAKSLTSRRLPSNHDIILVYGGSTDAFWNTEASYMPYDEADLPDKTRQKYCHRDERGRRYQLDNLLNPNKDRPNLTYEFMGVTRVWRWTKDRMEAARAAGMIHQTAPGRVPRFRRYLDEQKGLPLSDVWADINPLNSQARERLGYPTQKPLKLLERIIALSSKKDDLVLDPFCGCGTTVHAAASTGRRWVGIDVAYHAIELVADRLTKNLGLKEGMNFEVDGRPNDFASAVKLAERNKYQFQWWANYLVGVQQLREIKKGRDQGIDGEIFFPGGPGKGFGRILTSVKGGNSVGVSDVRDFRGVLEREGADGGLFICLRRPTRDMAQNAASAGFFSIGNSQYPRLQIVSIEAWFEDNQQPVIPSTAHLARRPSSVPTARATGKKSDARQTEMKFPIAGGMSDGTKVHWNPRTTFEMGEDDVRAI